MKGFLINSIKATRIFTFSTAIVNIYFHVHICLLPYFDDGTCLSARLWTVDITMSDIFSSSE